MAIDERNISAEPEMVAHDASPLERAPMDLDDLRRRLDSPLFARDPGLGAAAQVPGVRELTWEHVVNPTSQQPVVASPVPGELVPVPERPPLPTFAEMAAAPLAPVTSPSPSPASPAAAAPLHDVTDVDDAMLKILQQPTVERGPDPVVVGLAELIARPTPAVGQPIVESLASPPSMRVPLVEPPPAQAPVTPAPIAAPPVVAPPFTGGLGVVPVATPVGGVAATVAPPMSSVEAELNRLAFIPDHEDGGPVEVPEIVMASPPPTPPSSPATPLTPATGTVAVVSSTSMALPIVPADAPAGGPVLSEAAVFTPRAVTSTQHRARTYNDLIAESIAPRPAPQRGQGTHGLVLLIVLLLLVGGGLFAAKYYLLDRTHWTADVQPLATAVEHERGLTFANAVTVTTLAPEDYTLRLADDGLGISDANRTSLAVEWRALGVLNGPLDDAAVGLSAMAEQPAFYDPIADKVFVVAGVGDDYRTFALHRALTMALLDQHFHWSDGLADQPLATRVGTVALFDADALATADALLTDKAARTRVVQEVVSMYSTFHIPASAAPFASALLGRAGVAAWPVMDAETPAQRSVLEQSGAAPDAEVFDLRLLTRATTPTATVNARGVLFWYHALASRIDADTAWRVALSWKSDSVTTTTTSTGSCVAAVFQPVAGAQAPALAAFQAWAKAAPKATHTTVKALTSSSGVHQIHISACDPGDKAAKAGATHLSLGAAPLRAAQFASLVKNGTLTPAQAACAVYGADKVTLADERGVVDGNSGWAAPSHHPVPSLTGTSAACATAG